MVVEDSFYTSCILDMRLDIIRQHLVLTFSKKEVGLGACGIGSKVLFCRCQFVRKH